MFADVRELVRHRDLLLNWTIRDIKIRYKQSFLGAAWAILQPLSITLIFTVIFSFFVRVDTGGVPYPLFYYSALLPWTLLATTITFGVNSVVNNIQLVTKIYFPREILPLSALLASLVDFLVASIIFVAMIIFYRFPLSPTIVLVPVLLLIQIALMTGIILFASALTVFYRDIRFIVTLGLQLWLYMTPVIYPLNMVPERFRTLYLLNPMASLIESYRQVVLQGQWPEPIYLISAAVFALVLLVGSYVYFKRSEAVFADII